MEVFFLILVLIKILLLTCLAEKISFYMSACLPCNGFLFSQNELAACLVKMSLLQFYSFEVLTPAMSDTLK